MKFYFCVQSCVLDIVLHEVEVKLWVDKSKITAFEIEVKLQLLTIQGSESFNYFLCQVPFPAKKYSHKTFGYDFRG